MNVRDGEVLLHFSRAAPRQEYQEAKANSQTRPHGGIVHSLSPMRHRLGRRVPPAPLVLANLDFLACFLERHFAGTEGCQVAPLHAEDDGAEVGGITRDEWIPWHVVARGNSQPFLRTKIQRSTVFDHRVDERRLDLPCVPLGRILEY